MTNENENLLEETLDPDDWNSMRGLGHRMLDDWMTFLETIREKSVFSPLQKRLFEYMNEPLPQEGEEPEKVYNELLNIINTQYVTGNLHPRFWAWVGGTGTPFGMLANMLVGAINHSTNVSMAWPYHVEIKVLEWIKQIIGYPHDASGLLVSGASMGNFIGLTVARNSRANHNLRQKGLQGIPTKMTLYGSDQTHSCIQRSVELLGLGNEALRKIPIDNNFQIDIHKLEDAIKKDYDSGYQPFCVIGNAGTVNTGSFDDFNKLADICQREGLWLHIDGAFGIWTILTQKYRHKVAGIERADSLAFDLHKWMYMQYGIGCILIRHKESHYNTFNLMTDYLRHDENEGIWFSDLGVELSRAFRGLNVWMSLKEHGLKKYGRLIQQNIDQAQYLVRLIENEPKLELLAPVPLNIVCFRYINEELNEAALEQLNSKILLKILLSGKAMLSDTRINGKYTLRVAIVNHRSKREDFDLLVKEIIRIGDSLLPP